MYHVFCGLAHYPNGGMGDYCGRYDTLEAAMERLLGLVFDWWQIATTDDLGFLTLVRSGKRGEYGS